MEKQLLPPGLYDLLPPEAQQETHIVSTLLTTFCRFGYAQVTPPLLEFEDSLLSGRGETLASQTFRMMDPVSERMLCLRADMTMQVARIATSRMHQSAAPLRLCYAGPTVQMKGDTFRAERELMQAGVELIGSNNPAADAEVIIIAVEALQRLGVQGITVDINLPGVLKSLLSRFTYDATVISAIEQAVSRKDLTGLKKYGQPLIDVLDTLIDAAGNPANAIEKLRGIPQLPQHVADQIHHIEQVIKSLLTAAPEQVNVTIDPTESRGFEYHKTISFSIFSRQSRNELGRGGRYEITSQDNSTQDATGFTLYVGDLLRIAPRAKGLTRVYIPHSTPEAERRTLREQGFATIYGAHEDADPKAQAVLLECSHIYLNGQAVPL